MNKIYSFTLSVSIAIIFYFIFSSIPDKIEREKVIIIRVLDGDTVELNDGRIVRLANINAPEKDTLESQGTYDFLSSYINSSVELEIVTYDRYNRVIGRIYTPSYLNLRLIEKGYAHVFMLNPKENKIFLEKESEAIRKERGIWKRSPYFGCIKTSIKEKEELVEITNICEMSFPQATIKDESTASFEISINSYDSFILYSSNGSSDYKKRYLNVKRSYWNDDRDSLFIRDDKGLLLHYDSYTNI